MKHHLSRYLKRGMQSFLLTAGITLVWTLLWNRFTPAKDKRFAVLGAGLCGFITQDFLKYRSIHV